MWQSTFFFQHWSETNKRLLEKQLNNEMMSNHRKVHDLIGMVILQVLLVMNHLISIKRFFTDIKFIKYKSIVFLNEDLIGSNALIWHVNESYIKLSSSVKKKWRFHGFETQHEEHVNAISRSWFTQLLKINNIRKHLTTDVTKSLE